MHQKPPYFAAIDLGSNSCRLLVAKVEAGKLETVDAFSRVVRLSEGLSRSAMIGEQAMEKVWRTLEQSAKRLRCFRPVRLACVATEACRKAHNASAFLTQIKDTFGFEFRIISEEEEAHLTVRGLTSLLDPAYPYALVFDVGGGSTEVVFLRQFQAKPPEVVSWVSLPIGVVNLIEFERPESASSYLRVVASLRAALEKFGKRYQIEQLIGQQHVQLIGSSGTATTAAALHFGLRYYDRNRIDGSVLTFEQVKKVVKNLQMMSFEERVQHPCIGRDRADLVLGGMAIFEGLTSAWPIGCVTVADRGVRDGLVKKLYEDFQKEQADKAQAEHLQAGTTQAGEGKRGF